MVKCMGIKSTYSILGAEIIAASHHLVHWWETGFLTSSKLLSTDAALNVSNIQEDVLNLQKCSLWISIIDGKCHLFLLIVMETLRHVLYLYPLRILGDPNAFERSATFS